MQMVCPICGVYLKKLGHITIETAIRNKVWQQESSFTVGERKIEEWLTQLEDKEIDITYKYYKYGCECCGFFHDGTIHVSDIYPMK